MLKNLILCSSLIPLVLASCSPGRRLKPAPEIVGFTDADAEFLIIRLETLRVREPDTLFPDDAFEQLGIEIEELEVIDRWIGDCYDGTAYDLSPSYRLMVDRNACFGLRIWIERKDASG